LQSTLGLHFEAEILKQILDFRVMDPSFNIMVSSFCTDIETGPDVVQVELIDLQPINELQMKFRD